MAAVVLRLPALAVDNAADLKVQILDAASKALDSTVDALMGKNRGRDFQVISELLLAEGQKITGAMFEIFLNAKAADAHDIEPCRRCGRACKQHGRS